MELNSDILNVNIYWKFKEGLKVGPLFFFNVIRMNSDL